MLSVNNIVHDYGPKRALDNVSFEIETGRFGALLGPNGAGKSTLFSLLTRLFVPQSGTLHFGDINLAKSPREALGILGVVFQQPTMDLDLTVKQNLSYFAALHGMSGKLAGSAIDEALDRLSMRERAGEKVRNLNGGHRRRMELARSLIHRPRYLLLDEPTVGLDASSRSELTHYVHQLVDEQNMTVLWATHLVDEVLPSDQLVVLHHGKVVANGTCADVVGQSTLGERFRQLTAENGGAANDSMEGGNE